MKNDHTPTSALDVGVWLQAHGALHPLVPSSAGLRPGGVGHRGRAVEAGVEGGGQAAALLGLGGAAVAVASVVVPGQDGEEGCEECLTSEGSLIVGGLARRCLVPPPVRVHDGGDGARPWAWPDAGAVPG